MRIGKLQRCWASARSRGMRLRMSVRRKLTFRRHSAMPTGGTAGAGATVLPMLSPRYHTGYCTEHALVPVRGSLGSRYPHAVDVRPEVPVLACGIAAGCALGSACHAVCRRSMLVCAVLRGGECVLELLIQAGADLNHKDPRTVGGYPTRAPWATGHPVPPGRRRARGFAAQRL